MSILAFVVTFRGRRGRAKFTMPREGARIRTPSQDHCAPLIFADDAPH